MLAMEEVLSELNEDEVNEQGLPPGFRFHPTDEELITFYLASKVFNGTFCGVEIAEVDLNRCEPWELPDVAKMGEKEWYFFSLRDRKYPTGLRTNRATGAGYWKATGKDREVYSGSSGALLGMKKTLVFYKGRAPRGEKTKWVMHEYRLDGDFSYRHTCKEEWVICRIFNKAVVSGEKKNGLLLQGQNYLFEAAAATAGAWLPALLDAPGPATTTLLLECQSQNHNPILENLPNHFVNQQQDNHHHHLFPVNGLFETSAVTNKHILMNNNTENIGNNTSPSMLFKALLSHQDFSCCDELATSPKHCKTEANFSHIQLPPATAAEDNNNDNRSNCYWMDSKIQPNPYSNPLFSEFDCSFPGLTQPSAFASTAVNDTSTSIAFNRTGFQVIEKSWPLDA